MSVGGEPRKDTGGSFRGYWGVTRNIDELVAAQEALRRSETTLSTLVTTSPDMITLTDVTTGRFVMVNETFTRVCGYTREEAIGRTSVELGVWGSSPWACSTKPKVLIEVRVSGCSSPLMRRSAASTSRR